MSNFRLVVALFNLFCGVVKIACLDFAKRTGNVDFWRMSYFIRHINLACFGSIPRWSLLHTLETSSSLDEPAIAKGLDAGLSEYTAECREILQVGNKMAQYFIAGEIEGPGQ